MVASVLNGTFFRVLRQMRRLEVCTLGVRIVSGLLGAGVPGMLIRRRVHDDRFSGYACCLAFALLVLTCCGCNKSGDVRPPSNVPLRRLYESEFRLTPSGSMIRRFVFSPNGQLLAGSNWNEVRIWTFPEGKLAHDFSATVQGDCMAFSADGKEFLVLDQRNQLNMEIVRFDVESGKLLGKTKLQNVEKEHGGTTFRFSKDGTWLCMNEVYGNYAVWEVATGIRQFHKRLDVLGSPTVQENELTFYNGGRIDRYDVRTGEEPSHQSTKHHLDGAIRNSSGSIWAGYSEEKKAITLWDSEKDEYTGVTIPCDWHDWRGDQAAITDDGRRFIYHVAHGPTIFDWKVAVFDVATGKIVSEFDPPGAYFMEQPVVSPDGQYLFFAGSRAVFCPIEIATGKPVHKVADHLLAVTELSFTPDGKLLLVGSADKRQAWHVDTGKPGVTFIEFHHNPYIAAIDNEKAVVSGFRNGGLKVQEIGSGAVDWEFGMETYGYLSALQLSTDRKTFVGIMNDSQRGGVVRRWEAATGKIAEEKKLPARGQYSDRSGPDPRYVIHGLAIGGSRLLRLEEVRKGQGLINGTMVWGDTNLVLEDWTTMQVTNELRLPTPYFTHFVDTAHGTALVGIGSDDQYYDRDQKKQIYGSTYLMIWNVATSQELLRLKRDNSDYFSKFSLVAATRELQLVATASRRDHVDIWNAITGEHLQEFDTGNDVTALAFSDYGSLLATGHADGRVNIWDTQAAAEAAAETAARKR